MDPRKAPGQRINTAEMRGSTLLEPPPFDPAKSAIENHLEVTEVEDLGRNVFTNTRPQWHPAGGRGVYGGAVLALCLSAAYRTVPEGFFVNSCHCYFLDAASAEIPLLLHVENLRDGRSFATRTVQARQRGSCVFTTTVSFARRGSGVRGGPGNVIEHAAVMPTPEQLGGAASPPEEWEDEPALLRSFPVQTSPLHLLNGADADPHKRRVCHWIRSRDRISDEGGHVAHIAALGNLSDSYFIETVTRVHGLWRMMFAPQDLPTLPEDLREYVWAMHLQESDPEKKKEETEGDDVKKAMDRDLDPAKWIGRPEVGMMVSLDHSIYFHNPLKVKADEWMLYEMDSPWTGDGRGLVTGRIWAKDGTLLATCVQEGTVRLKAKPAGMNEAAKL
ncbi:uncharacterized protein E0L32_011307 [Thyridium curvatum]|uniref:Acyl-CoA thioesterase II n=1 Tax=Thyridium curvatum TaxID=1093900 RepID=A0A507BQA7_9PEZI|nr:uncharacterized protein E0L32_011307 [Thyridium curvatum]TPX18990.1 hypothetical protein E0L32_011307 [Thyridium curvatum]